MNNQINICTYKYINIYIYIFSPAARTVLQRWYLGRFAEQEACHGTPGVGEAERMANQNLEPSGAAAQGEIQIIR